MSDERSRDGARKAIVLIREGEFSLACWESVYSEIDCEPLLRLLSSIRNALSYGSENGAIKGIVKHGFLYSAKCWDEAHPELSGKICESGDFAIKEANAYIKKRKIKVE